MPKTPESKAKGCPYCGQPSRADHAPFCSRGCKDRDLLKWLDGAYRVAGPPADEQDLGGVDRHEDDG